jgi:polyribonucleotide nucleotidyltransferase
MGMVKLFEDFQGDNSMSIDELFDIADAALRVSVGGGEDKPYTMTQNRDKKSTYTSSRQGTLKSIQIIQQGEDFSIFVTRGSKILLEDDNSISVKGTGRPDRSKVYDANLAFQFGMYAPFREGVVDRLVKSPVVRRYLTGVFVELAPHLEGLDEAQKLFRSSLDWVPQDKMPEGWRKLRRARGAFGRF